MRLVPHKLLLPHEFCLPKKAPNAVGGLTLHHPYALLPDKGSVSLVRSY
jgi:hypothetical protein